MAKIYISYQHNDQPFVKSLVNILQTAGHQIKHDENELSPGVDWQTVLDISLKSSEIFIVIISKNTSKSPYVLSEIGAARAYALESNRMLVVPIVIDDISLPLSIQSIQAIIQPDRDLNKILQKVELAISAFIGRRTAIESASAEAAKNIQSKAAEYITIAISSLEKLETRDRYLSYLWYFLGFISLILGIYFALCSLANIGQQTTLSLQTMVLVILKAFIVIALLGICAKYAFSLGKSHSIESLKSSDRIHAIRFGEFYLRAFNDKTTWSELKEVFQHWNIDRNSSFSSFNVSHFDPKMFEPLIELLRLIDKKNFDKGK